MGEKIRKARKDKGMTLSEMSDSTKLSISYISQLERGMIEPSISSLRKISKVLEMPIYLFVDDEVEKNELLVKVDERVNVNYGGGNVRYQIASPSSKDSFTPNALLMSFEIDTSSVDIERFVSHPSDEIVVVTQGSVMVYVGSGEILLNEGDTIYIRGNTPHNFYNAGEVIAKGYSIFSPPTWPSQK